MRSEEVGYIWGTGRTNKEMAPVMLSFINEYRRYISPVVVNQAIRVTLPTIMFMERRRRWINRTFDFAQNLNTTTQVVLPFIVGLTALQNEETREGWLWAIQVLTLITLLSMTGMKMQREQHRLINKYSLRIEDEVTAALLGWRYYSKQREKGTPWKNLAQLCYNVRLHYSRYCQQQTQAQHAAMEAAMQKQESKDKPAAGGGRGGASSGGGPAPGPGGRGDGGRGGRPAADFSYPIVQEDISYPKEDLSYGSAGAYVQAEAQQTMRRLPSQFAFAANPAMRRAASLVRSNPSLHAEEMRVPAPDTDAKASEPSPTGSGAGAGAGAYLSAEVLEALQAHSSRTPEFKGDGDSGRGIELTTIQPVVALGPPAAAVVQEEEYESDGEASVGNMSNLTARTNVVHMH